MTDEQIQISKNSELMVQVISLVASYAIENDMSPDETIKTAAENLLSLLKIATFENWEKKTLQSVISTSEDCVSRKQAKIDVIPDSLYTSEQVIALLDNLSPVTPERKVGRWIKYEKEFTESGTYRQITKPVIECSICQEKIAGHIGIMNYCPNCGAKMEGEE